MRNFAILFIFCIYLHLELFKNFQLNISKFTMNSKGGFALVLMIQYVNACIYLSKANHIVWIVEKLIFMIFTVFQWTSISLMKSINLFSYFLLAHIKDFKRSRYVYLVLWIYIDTNCLYTCMFSSLFLYVSLFKTL